MMNENKLKTLEELFKEAENLKNKAKDHYERYYSTIGVVVDCSNIFRYESNRDYTQKLKIIDHTYQ